MSDNSDLKHVVDEAELLAAMFTSDEENLTWFELAQLLGVAPNTAGNLPGVELFNACLHVQYNPAVRALSTPERIRAIRSASAVMDYLNSNRGA